MEFNLNRSLEILSSTPAVLEQLLSDLSDDWLYSNEGENTWSPHTVVGHLIYGDETNWIARARKILSDVDNRFEPFNRQAQFDLYNDRTIRELLTKFAAVRKNSLKELSSIELNEKTLSRKGIHPEFGEVTLSQLLSTWTVHDLDHINQISRVLAKQYHEAVGPWKAFLGVLKRGI
ncbi:MAG TPA: DinB family protein [Chryseolinea sp.]|nr:DinB family protein [Chryseolinea sp.]